MPSMNALVQEYTQQLSKGVIQKAYRGIMAFMSDLRSELCQNHPDFSVTGLYFGYMDMTYFALFPPALKDRKLKIAVVFLHESCRFELWLAAANKQVQSKYWRAIEQSGWNKYRLAPSVQGADAIVEHIVAAEPNFDDLPALTKQIERAARRFIDDVERFLTDRQI